MEEASALFPELKALVALAETGSMERAASGLYLTPSALTRRIQRLEAELGLVLIDRRFKPPKLTQAGFQVLEKGRAILSSAVPHDLEGVTLRQEQMQPVEGRSPGSRRSKKCPDFYRRSCRAVRW